MLARSAARAGLPRPGAPRPWHLRRLAIEGARGYYGAMDSGLFAKVLSSPEVIVTSLALIFLLPLVFFIASTRSRRRSVRVAPRPGAARLRRAAAVPAPWPGPRSAARAAPPEEKDEEPEDLA